MSEDKAGPFVGIAGTIAGISMVIVVILAVLAKEHLMVAAYVVGALVVLGIFLGFAASKKN
ncbi:MAG: hypothetical protein JW958_09190 [Candidatus Eisenbacteria bacterium]|nr:hypothetical protein [Candidatus Eisenbacteria bacterium]